MSVSLIGFKHPQNFRMTKNAIAAKLAGVALEMPEFTFGSNHTPAFKLNCSPTGAIPVLQTEEGYLFESGAILRYIARSDRNNAFLYGRTTFEASQVDAWLDFTTTELDSAA